MLIHETINELVFLGCHSSKQVTTKLVGRRMQDVIASNLMKSYNISTAFVVNSN